MLTESKNVRQNPGEAHRRWFSDRDFDLIVWQNRAGDLTAFQLCYDKRAVEHALIWKPGQPFEHYRVDNGEHGSRRNLAPMMTETILPDLNRLIPTFQAASAEIAPAVRRQVLAVLRASQPFTIHGEGPPGGVYLLRIRLTDPAEVVFGRFRGGKPLSLPAGEYLYIGSAYGIRGAATLANRLLRHATRATGQPHHMRGSLRQALSAAGLAGKLPERKTLRWHIDYLLELPQAEIISILAMRTPEKLEKPIAEQLEAHPAARPIAPNLGASDHPGHSHLLQIQGEGWWEILIKDVQSYDDIQQKEKK